ncbi:uncharacterized protein A4U43_C08F17820 [Asparagus officinalis]|nr:uncharacterized protein A4U43_C08F17820 [Asparagus officinalis]
MCGSFIQVLSKLKFHGGLTEPEWVFDGEGILKARRIISNGLHWPIRDEMLMKVIALMKDDTREWNTDVIHDISPLDEAKTIMSIPPINTAAEDVD